MNCSSCGAEVMRSWTFCPNCGERLVTTSSANSKQAKSAPVELPMRLTEIVRDYELLTGSGLNPEIVQDFLNHPAVGRLSVIDRDRRLKSGRAVRQKLNNRLFSLDLQSWLDHIYDNPPKARTTRVWITTKGEKYHLNRDCKGLTSGQNYARIFGKDTYNPQFEEIHYAAFVLGKVPCSICKPPRYERS